MFFEWAQKADNSHPTRLINIQTIHYIYYTLGCPTFVLSFEYPNSHIYTL